MSSDLEPTESNADEPTADGCLNDEWPAGDLESAYRRALEANDAVEWEFEQLPESTDNDQAADNDSHIDNVEASSDQEDNRPAATVGADDDASQDQEPDPVEAALPQRVLPRQVDRKSVV
jgi:hypothetical protein